MVEAKLNTARFERDLALYLRETSKSVEDAINFKLYDAARAAIKETPKADKKTVKETLDAACNKYPDRTVAEMLVVIKKRETGEEIYDLDTEVKKLKGKRLASIGFTKAGWIPALKKLLRYVGREGVTVAGLTKAAFGGAEPARTTGGKVIGSAFNDVTGTGNKGHVEEIKIQGAQAGLDKASSDMETYLSKKLQIPIDKFNRS